jgi:molecular chaperone GrpE
MEKRDMKDLEIKEDQPLEEIKDKSEDLMPVESSADEKLHEVEGDLSKSREELLEAKNLYLRLYAEFENYKKRMQKEKEELVKYGNELFVIELLTILDNLEMALHHAEKDATAESLIQGVELTIKEFRRVLDKFGVKEIDAFEKPFDPVYHHAMSHVERNDIEDNIIIEEYRKGYMLRDKVIRASLVSVSKKEEDHLREEGEEIGEQNTPDENNDIKEDA